MDYQINTDTVFEFEDGTATVRGIYPRFENGKVIVYFEMAFHVGKRRWVIDLTTRDLTASIKAGDWTPRE